MVMRRTSLIHFQNTVLRGIICWNDFILDVQGKSIWQVCITHKWEQEAKNILSKLTSRGPARGNSNPGDTADSSLAKYTAHSTAQPLKHHLENRIQNKAEEWGTSIFLKWIEIQLRTVKLSETPPLKDSSQHYSIEWILVLLFSTTTV